MTEQAYDRIRELAHVDNGTCAFPDAHAPGHARDHKFTVLFDTTRPGDPWEELTEDEIIAKYGIPNDDGSVSIPEFMHTSDWDFWYAP